MTSKEPIETLEAAQAAAIIETLEAAQAAAITKAIQASSTMSGAARRLKIDRRTLYRRCEAHGIDYTTLLAPPKRCPECKRTLAS